MNIEDIVPLPQKEARPTWRCEKCGNLHPVIYTTCPMPAPPAGAQPTTREAKP